MLLLHVSDTVIDAVGVPDVNTMLAQTAGGGVRVYRLSTGEYQVNTVNGDQEYVAIWEGCHTASADLKAYSTATWELLSDEDGCEFSDVALPDLIVVSIVPSESDGVDVSVTVKNQGEANSGSFNTRVVATFCRGGSDTIDLGNTSNLAPGESAVLGDWFDAYLYEICQFTATVDVLGQVTESNELNNTLTVQNQVSS